MRSRKHVLKIIDERIDEYTKKIAKLTPDQLARMKLSEAGIYSGGASIIENVMMTAQITGKQLPR